MTAGKGESMQCWVGLGKEQATRRNKQGRMFWIEETASENERGGVGMG